MQPQDQINSDRPSPGAANSDSDGSCPRRNVLVSLAALAVGALVSVAPLVPGLAVFLDPLLRRKKANSGGDEFIRVGTMDTVSDQGASGPFPVIANLVDAWTFSPKERIGAVYICPHQDNQGVNVFNVICPHAGCPISYRSSQQKFHCPCHNSSFTLEGVRAPDSPSPRDLDKMEVDTERLVKTGEIAIRFVNYYPGKEDRVRKV